LGLFFFTEEVEVEVEVGVVGVAFFFFGGGERTGAAWSSPSSLALLERVRLKWREVVGEDEDMVDAACGILALIVDNANARGEYCLKCVSCRDKNLPAVVSIGCNSVGSVVERDEGRLSRSVRGTCKLNKPFLRR